MRRGLLAGGAVAGLLMAFVVTLEPVFGLFGQVYRIEGGAVAAQAAITMATPAAVASHPSEKPATPGRAVPDIAKAPAGAGAAVDLTPSSPLSSRGEGEVRATATTAPAVASTRLIEKTNTATATRAPPLTETPTRTASPLPSPTPTFTPTVCAVATLTFVPDKQVLVTTGGIGKGRVRLQNSSKVAAKAGVRVTVTAGGERLRALTLAGETWDPSSSRALVVDVGVIEGGTDHDIVFAYELATPMQPAARRVEDVVLRLEAALPGCTTLSRADAVAEVRLRVVEPKPPTVGPMRAPVEVKPVEVGIDLKPVDVKPLSVEGR